MSKRKLNETENNNYKLLKLAPKCFQINTILVVLTRDINNQEMEQLHNINQESNNDENQLIINLPLGEILSTMGLDFNNQIFDGLIKTICFTLKQCTEKYYEKDIIIQILIKNINSWFENICNEKNYIISTNPIITNIISSALMFGYCINSKDKFDNFYKTKHKLCFTRHKTYFPLDMEYGYFKGDYDFPIPVFKSISKRFMLTTRGLFLAYETNKINWILVNRNSFLGQLIFNKLLFSLVWDLDWKYIKCDNCSHLKKYFLDVTGIIENNKNNILDPISNTIDNDSCITNRNIDYFLQELKMTTTCVCLNPFEIEGPECNYRFNTFGTSDIKFIESCNCYLCQPYKLSKLSMDIIKKNKIDISNLPIQLQNEIKNN